MIKVLSAADIETCRERLLQRREALRAALTENSRSEENVSFATQGPDVHDWKDEAFREFTRNLHGADVAHVRNELNAIEVALQRVNVESYGTCAECGNDIGRERLLAQPSAERCLKCQEGAELGHP